MQGRLERCGRGEHTARQRVVTARRRAGRPSRRSPRRSPFTFPSSAGHGAVNEARHPRRRAARCVVRIEASTRSTHEVGMVEHHKYRGHRISVELVEVKPRLFRWSWTIDGTYTGKSHNVLLRRSGRALRGVPVRAGDGRAIAERAARLTGRSRPTPAGVTRLSSRPTIIAAHVPFRKPHERHDPGARASRRTTARRRAPRVGRWPDPRTQEPHDRRRGARRHRLLPRVRGVQPASRRDARAASRRMRCCRGSCSASRLLIALGFEFVNGFHDTANAVATVIYTHSLPPQFAVVWSGCSTSWACWSPAARWPSASSRCCRWS